MSWHRKSADCTGVVLFKGSIPPRAQDFAPLKKQGFRMKLMEVDESHHWGITADHAEYGSALLLCPRDFGPPPMEWMMFDGRLTPAERERGMEGKSSVLIHMPGKHSDLLRDRKNLLRYMSAVLGDDGAMALDTVAMRCWSREALDDELAHDADVDVDALFTIHLIGDDQAVDAEGDPMPLWLHTHGLAQIGFFDFDVLRPSADIAGERGIDLLRALAFKIVEGEAKPTTPLLSLAEPGGRVRLVEVGEFNRKASAEVKAARGEMGEQDEDHNRDRAIICEPQGFLSRFLGKPQPSKFFQSEPGDEMLIQFSGEATELMAQRAARTLHVFEALAEEFAEFAEFGFLVIAKLGYPSDGAQSPYDREHLWFEVHGFAEGKIDATLQSPPVYIARMAAGQRGMHDLSLLTDWGIITPVGMINPRNTKPARMVREHKDELREMFRKAKEQGE